MNPSKKIILFFLPLFFYSFYKLPDNCGGIYRWDNKILIDSVGLIVFTKNPVPASVHSLVIIPKPPNAQLGKNRSLPERRKVTVTVMLIGLGKETDHDYHLILASLNFKDSLIAEIPDPSCDKLAHFPGLRDKYEKARAFIEQEVDPTPGAIHFIPQPIKVKITGVLFFDKKAHGNGHSRNDIEIHPVLEIKKAS